MTLCAVQLLAMMWTHPLKSCISGHAGPEMLTGNKYIISNNNTSLRINGFNIMLHNNMNITCTVTVVPGSQYMYVLPNSASENRLLIVEGKY